MIPRAIKRLFHQTSLTDPTYRFLFAPGPQDEVVSFDCETTGLDVRRDDVISIAAVRIRGNRILTSERFGKPWPGPAVRMNIEAIKVHRLREMDVAAGEAIRQIIPRFLHFIGGRPLVGYYVDFDVRMVNRYLLDLIGIELAQSADRGLQAVTTSVNTATPRRVRGSICRSRLSCATSTCRRWISTTRSTTPS